MEKPAETANQLLAVRMQGVSDDGLVDS